MSALTFDQAYQQARHHLQLWQFDQAARLLQSYIESEPTDSQGYWYLGLIQLLQNQSFQAQLTWHLGLETQTNAELAIQQLHRLLKQEAQWIHQQGHPTLAEILYKHCLEFDLKDWDCLRALAQILVEFEDYEDGIAIFRTVVEQSPASAEAHFYLGLMLGKMAYISEAIQEFQQALKLHSGWDQLWYEFGICLACQHDLQHAIHCFEKVLTLTSEPVIVYDKLIDLQLRLGQLNEAILSLSQVIEANAPFFQVYRRYVSGPSKVLGLIDRLMTDPHSQATYGGLSQILQNHDSYQLAAQQAKQQVSEATLDPLPTRSQMQSHPPELQPIAAIYPLTWSNAAISPFNDRYAADDRSAATVPSPSTQGFAQKRSLEAQEELFPVAGFQTSQEWISISNFGHYQLIEPEHWICLEPSVTTSPLLQSRLRRCQFRSPETFVVTLRQGRAHYGSYKTLYASYASAAITADRYLLADVSLMLPPPEHLDRPLRSYTHRKLEQHPILALESLPPVHYIPGKVVMLPLGAVNYFHWFTDVLPALHHLIKTQINFEDIDYFLIHGLKDCEYQHRGLELLGIPLTKVINTLDVTCSHIQADSLIIPSLAGHFSWLTQPAGHFLQELFWSSYSADSLDQPISRLYISRQKARWRRVVNEVELIQYLDRLGFQFAYFEDLPIAQQVSLMAVADVVISPHGAGLTNLIFCRPGTKVIEILPPNSILSAYWAISQQLGLEHYSLLGQVMSSPHLCRLLQDPALDYQDMVVDLKELDQLFQLAGIVS